MAKEIWEVEGIDITADATMYARDELGLNVVTGDFLYEDFMLERYDVICLWDTIEHLKQPHRYIEKAASLLKPGGFIFLTTGDVGSLNARLRKGSWRMIHPPTHLFFFSKRTLKMLLEKYGLKTVQSKCVTVFRSFGSMVHGLMKKKLKDRYHLVYDIPIPLNLGDILFIAAQKGRSSAATKDDEKKRREARSNRE